jgi:hypothetical protein
MSLPKAGVVVVGPASVSMTNKVALGIVDEYKDKKCKRLIRVIGSEKALFTSPLFSKQLFFLRFEIDSNPV